MLHKRSTYQQTNIYRSEFGAASFQATYKGLWNGQTAYCRYHCHFLIFGGLHGWMAILLACLHVCLPAFLPEGCKQEIKVSEPLTHGKLAESWKVVDVSDLYITGERSLVAQPNARIACETVGVLLMQLFRRQNNPT